MSTYEISRLKITYKIFRTHGLDDKVYKEQFMATAGDRWHTKTRTYFAEWDRVKEHFGSRIPKLDRVKYRAMVLEALKKVKEMNVDPEVIIEKYVSLGCDRALAEEILRFLGLYEAKLTREATA